MYTAVLFLHSLLRWVALATGANVLFRSSTGLSAGRSFEKADKLSALFFVICMDLQLTLGVLLHLGLSPLTRGGMANMAAAMKNRGIRYFLVEHPVLMLAAVVMAHLGWALCKRAPDAAQKFRRLRTYAVLALVLLLCGIPWPFLAGIGRDWLRLP